MGSCCGGFRYDALELDTGWAQRLDWVRRQGFRSWSPEPYEQLAAYYSATGDEDAARRIRVAKNDDELTQLRTTRRWRSLGYRTWRRPLGWHVGDDYRRQRAAWLLAATLAAASALFRQAEGAGAMVPDVPRRSRSAPCGAAHPCFDSWFYGADVVLPIVDFGQDTAYRPVETAEVWVRWRSSPWDGCWPRSSSPPSPVWSARLTRWRFARSLRPVVHHRDRGVRVAWRHPPAPNGGDDRHSDATPLGIGVPRSPRRTRPARSSYGRAMFDSAFPVVATTDLPWALGAVTETLPRISLWVSTDGSEPAVERLRGGLTITQEPEQEPWGEIAARVRDPGGNTIVLGQAGPDSGD